MRGKNIFRQMGEDIRGFGFKQWFLLGLNVVLALASLACLLGLRTVSHTLNSTTAADRFRGESEMRFAQVACYMPVGQGKQETDIFAFREKLEAAMVEQSLEAPENGSLYVDAYCGSAEVTVASEHGSGTVTALGVGGDFFYFHPLDLRGGTYISGDDLMDDLVVLDEAMAWRLFGSTDLAGMDMTINGQPFVVAGVIARETDFATKKAYTADGGIFMSYAALNDLLAGESGGTVQDQEEEQPAPQVQSALSIDCYEIVLPDPISGYAMNVVKENFQVGEGDVVENSARYSFSHLWSVVRSFGERSMRTNGVIYPYWENALRLTEDYAALLLLLAILLALCPLTVILVTAVKVIRRSYRAAKAAIPAKVEAAVEKRREEKYEKALEAEAGQTGEDPVAASAGEEVEGE